MSLLSPNRLMSRNQLSLLISANEITLQHIKGWLSPRVALQAQVNYASADGDKWREALLQIDTLFSKIKVPAKTPLKIVLSSECLRFLTLPAQHAFLPEAEKNAYAKAFYDEVYGERVNDWEIRQDDAPPHLPSISVAMDKFLLEQLIKIAEKYQLILTTVEPYVMTAVNHLKKEIGCTDGFLAMIENNRLVLIQLQGGHLINLKIEAIGQEWQTSLHQMLLRESLLAAEKAGAQDNILEKPTVLLYAPHITNAKIQKIADWPITMIGQQGQSVVTHTNALMEALV